MRVKLLVEWHKGGDNPLLSFLCTNVKVWLDSEGLEAGAQALEPGFLRLVGLTAVTQSLPVDWGGVSTVGLVVIVLGGGLFAHFYVDVGQLIACSTAPKFMVLIYSIRLHIFLQILFKNYKIINYCLII